MNNKKIPWCQPQIGVREYELIKQVLDSNYLNEGNYTAQFEQQIAGLLGVKHAVATTSGTAAMFLALKGLGIGPGDEVIVPDITFVATANAVDLCGARPVLVDVNPADLTLDAVAFERAITAKTKAVLPVHVTGRAANMEAIIAIARAHDILVVEDAAEAFMSKRKGKFLGTFGQAGCFSFSPFKIIMTGQGGMLVTNDDALALRVHQLKDQGRSQQGSGGDDIHEIVGYNFKFTNLQAAVGLGQLETLSERWRRKQEIYRSYREQLDDSKAISLFSFDLDGGELPLWVDGFSERRDELVAYLQTNNIDCRKFWLPLHQQKPYRLPDENFPHSTAMSARSLWLPSALDLSREDIRFVCQHINYFFKNKLMTNFPRDKFCQS